MRKLLLICVFACFGLGENLITQPFFSLKIDANIMDIKRSENLVFIATDASRVEIYDIQKNAFLKPIILNKVKTYFGDEMDAKAFSIDVYKDRVAVLYERSFGKKSLLVEDKNGTKFNFDLDNEAFKKVLFLDKFSLILATISNEIYHFDLRLGSAKILHKFSNAAYGDMDLDKNFLVFGDEGGKIYVFDTAKRQILSIFDVHKDFIKSISAKNGVIMSGSSDKSVNIIKNNEIKNIKCEFLVYCVSLDKFGKFGAFMSSEDGDISVLDTQNLSLVAKIKTKQGIINKIEFLGENELISANYGNEILFWRFR